MENIIWYFSLLGQSGQDKKIKRMTSHAGEDVGKEEYIFFCRWENSHYRNNVDIPQKLINQGLGYRSVMTGTQCEAARLKTIFRKISETPCANKK